MKQPEYLEIYPSEVAARKISKHLDKMIDVKPRVYRKTLIRYKQLAQLLLECVGKIVRMLQSEMLLSSEDSEFQELMSEFDMDQLDDLRDSVDALGSFADKNTSSATKKVAAETLQTYKLVFNQASQFDFGYAEVNECANLLSYWINSRFSGINPNFKYPIKQLPIWATYIIIAYGKYHSIGYQQKFAIDFKLWCDDLSKDLSNCWALPANIFVMTKNIDPANFTMNAVVIYDALINGCLYQLLDQSIPMDSSYIAKLVKEHHPNKTKEIRVRFTKQKELMQSLGLHMTKCDSEDLDI